MAIDVNISTEFINDTDTPSSYVGAGSYKVKVKADESGLEFVADSGGSDTNIMNANLTADANRTQNMNSFSMYFNNGKQFKWLNNVAPTIGEGSFDLQGYGTNPTDILESIKNGSSTNVYRKLGNGEYRHQVITGGGTYSIGYRDYFEIGNGVPSWLQDAPAGGQVITTGRINGQTVYRLQSLGSSTTYVMSTNEYQIRNLSNNYVHIVKNTSGEWVFDNDGTGTTTPETGVRAKFYGTVKTVSPSASVLDTAFSVRNNTDTDYLFKVLGDGTTYMRVGQDLYLQGGGNIIMRWETNGAVRCRDYSNAFGQRVFESNDFQWRNNSNLLLESLDVNGRRIQKALNSATSDGSLSASDMSFYIDESTNTLKVKVKYSDGTTIKIGTVNLV